MELLVSLFTLNRRHRLHPFVVLVLQSSCVATDIYSQHVAKLAKIRILLVRLTRCEIERSHLFIAMYRMSSVAALADVLLAAPLDVLDEAAARALADESRPHAPITALRADGTTNAAASPHSRERRKKALFAIAEMTFLREIPLREISRGREVGCYSSVGKDDHDDLSEISETEFPCEHACFQG